MSKTPLSKPITAGQVGPTKRRAIVVLFIHGMNFDEIGRLFRLRRRVVEEVLRRWNRKGR
jgi:transposase